MAKARVEYFVPKNIPDVDFSDPMGQGFSPDDALWAIDAIQIEPEEEIVGMIGTLEGDTMNLTDVFTRRAIVLHNRVKQEFLFITPDRAGFGYDQLPVRTIPRIWNSQEKQEQGSVAEVLERETARAPHTDILKLWKSRGGDGLSQPKTGGFGFKPGS